MRKVSEIVDHWQVVDPHETLSKVLLIIGESMTYDGV
jgi:hypothetical protein